MQKEKVCVIAIFCKKNKPKKIQKLLSRKLLVFTEKNAAQ